MIQNSISDDVKEKDECYATIDKIRRLDPNVPGTYVDLSANNAANTTINVPLQVKIPISSFLIFYNLKWFAEWMGKICIEIYPSYKNLVVASCVDPTFKSDVCNFYASGTTTATAHTLPELLAVASTDFHVGFHNINEEFYGITANTSAAWNQTNNLKKIKFSANDHVADHIQIRTAQYMLQADVYDGIAQRYLQKPLVFPIQTIESKDFTTAIGNAEDDIDTVALKHCDAAFVVFKKNINTTTCFENPNLSHVTFNINGKYYPREHIDTLDDVKSRNLTLDALNCNRSLITQIPKDLQTSI